MEASLLTVIIRRYYPQTATNVQALVASNSLLEKLSEKVYQKAEQAVQNYADTAARIKTVTRMLKAWRKKEYRNIDKSSIFIAIVILLYYVNPIDLIPDFIPVIGGLDDLILLGFLLKVIDKEIEKFTTWEQQQATAE
ncbi:MAG TPA: DUF1232 domain-containing protein [Chitinophagales bacterium]|jgi:uncharacterized membrane protein YkvA (DUF1232 family)|nr:DUF1232 domain-containing protein [Chitinophagales bacterium]HQG38510.1 DUF1232 domain-containing protein [Chitinophagales bacterium]